MARKKNSKQEEDYFESETFRRKAEENSGQGFSIWRGGKEIASFEDREPSSKKKGK